MKNLQKHYAALLMAIAMTASATAHTTSEGLIKVPTPYIADVITISFVDKMAFYKENFTGEANDTNVFLLADMLNYLHINAYMASADDIKFAEITINELRRRSKGDETLRALLDSCEKTIHPNDDRKWLMDAIRIHGKELVYNNNRSIIKEIIYKMERLATISLFKPDIDELRGIYEKWVAICNNDKSVKDGLARIGELLDIMDKDIENRQRNGVDGEYAKQLDQYNRDTHYADYSSRPIVLKNANKFIKSHAKNMNQATLDYTRGIYNQWSSLFMTTERKEVMAINKTIEKIQNRIIKEKQAK